MLAAVITIIIAYPVKTFSQNKGVKGFDRAQMDTSVDPTVDFYDYAVGGWLKNNPIPDEYSRWGSFELLAERNYKILRKILEDAANDTNAKEGSIEQKVGDFYYTGMDTVQIEKDGYNPIKPELKSISEIKSLPDVYKEVAKLYLGGTSSMFRF